MIENRKAIERAVIVGVIPQGQSEEQAKEYLEELAFLVNTAGGIVEKIFTQKLTKPDPRTYIGTGKLQEIKAYMAEHKPDILIFDDELSPSQIRNIERDIECKILDRSNLILDIFASRARSAQARTQVELAQFQYLLPRLTRMWTHLSKQKGGIGMKGPGETEIETDRRIVRDRITLLKDKLEVIAKQNETQRRNRQEMFRVALVGYTNVGKSTILNLISKSDVLAENKLFATLDTTVRKVTAQGKPFLLSDTVGFIRKLPHHLIESFNSTLAEVKEADLLLHVVDVSHSQFEEHIAVVNQTLKDLEVMDKPVIMVFNKIDALSDEQKAVDVETTWMHKANTPAIFISAQNKTNTAELLEMIGDRLPEVSYY